VTCGELSGFVSPSDPLNENLAARFIRQISEALDYLHNNNIILVNLSVRETHIT
jgi:serine/threonine protein kinase